jgi:DNA-directed RNA polymerase specialized sigma subunit
VTKNMYTVAGDGPCNEELALRMQTGDKNAAELLISQNEGYLTELARAYTPWCELEDLKQGAALSLLDAARRFDLAYETKLLTYATPAIEAALPRLRPPSLPSNIGELGQRKNKQGAETHVFVLAGAGKFSTTID